MKWIFKAAAAYAALAVLLTGCSEKPPAAENTPSEVPPAAGSSDMTSVEQSDFDLTRIADASRVSVLTDKYGCVGVSYEMDYGELYDQNMTFFRNRDNEVCYVGKFGDDYEYYDGKYDYWQESAEEGTQCFAYFGVAGADTHMDLDSYIFSYTPEDKLTVNGYTQNDDGSYIIDAAETLTDSYEDASGETVTQSFRYEYMLSATADLELVELICSCTDTETGEVDSKLDMKVDYGAKEPEIPSFMDETFMVTIITIKPDGSELSEEFDVPVGFMPYFVTPSDGDYVFSYDREGTDIIEDTFMISSPCTVYVTMQETPAEEQ